MTYFFPLTCLGKLCSSSLSQNVKMKQIGEKKNTSRGASPQGNLTGAKSCERCCKSQTYGLDRKHSRMFLCVSNVTRTVTRLSVWAHTHLYRSFICMMFVTKITVKAADASAFKRFVDVDHVGRARLTCPSSNPHHHLLSSFCTPPSFEHDRGRFTDKNDNRGM